MLSEFDKLSDYCCVTMNPSEEIIMSLEVFENMKREIEQLRSDNHALKHDYDMLKLDKIWGDAIKKRLKVEKVIFNPPATIIFFNDGAKTVVKCTEDDTYNYKTGLILGYLKRRFKGAVYKMFIDTLSRECQNGKNLYDYIMYQELGWKKYKEFLRKWLPAEKYKEVIDIWEPKEKAKTTE